MDKPADQLKQEAKNQEGLVEKNAPHAAATVTKPVRRYRAYVFQIGVVAAMIAFAVLFFYARTIPYFKTDLTVTLAIQSIQIPGFDALMRFVSAIGFAPWSYLITAAAILYIFFIGLRWEAVMCLFAALGVTLLGALVKIIVERPRPTPDLVNVFATITGYSFPSGHVLYFTAFFGFLWFLLYTLTVHSWQRTLGMIVTGALVALVGISRIYLGEHWPSDVLGAYLLGTVWLAATIYVYRWGKPRFFVHQPAAADAKPQNTSAESPQPQSIKSK